MKFSTLNLNGLPIFSQLQLEEALLRADDREWCLINMGSPEAIVMGISGKPEELLHLAAVGRDQIPVIKRFSGGGTVYIDPNTLFVSFIVNGESQPKPILQWAEKLYKTIFEELRLVENDFCFGDLKIGGNAQYIQRGRWLLHTSFLWDYSPEKMEYLKLPKKRPLYRKDRSHSDFLTTLKPLFSCKKALVERLITHFSAQEFSLEDVESVLSRPHRKGSEILNLSFGLSSSIYTIREK
ncbi:MAG: lipoate--protein ligase family protein [Chlamydiales bacterium]